MASPGVIEFFPSPVLVSVEPEEGPAAGDTPVILRPNSLSNHFQLCFFFCFFCL